MALSESTALSGYSVLADKAIRVSYRTEIRRDGVSIAVSTQEELLVPGQDVSARDQELQDICAVIWTPEVIAAYQAGN